MSDEQQPRAEWIFPEQKKKHPGRVWLIVGLAVAAVIIVGVLLFFLIPRDQTPAPATSESPSPSATSSPTPSASPSDTTEPEPSITPNPSPQPDSDPDLETFTAEVQPRLDDAVRGLDLVQDNQDVGAQIVDSLQQDAEILSGSAAPNALTDDWNAALADYTGALNGLRDALDDGSDPQGAIDESRASLNTLRELVGI